MKTNCWLLLAALLSTSAFAQPAATPSGNVPPASTPAPAAKAEEKPAVAKKSAPPAELKTIPLTAGPATVVASNVNVRGQAKLNSEVVTRLTRGDQVTVLEEITLKESKPDEPSAWAKILLPANTRVWVHGMFLDGKKAVVPARLNVRSGPGENYSVLGLLQRGETVKQVGERGDWIQIEAPEDAYAFMAAQYLRQEPPAAPEPAPPAEPPPAPAIVAESPTIAPAPVDPPPAPPAEPPIVAKNEPPAAIEAPIVEEPAVEEPPPPRIVQRQGIVRGTVSIQAPTPFGLVSPTTGRTINYLYTSSTNLDMNRYKGLHIVVTGEEGLDERWKNTPVITIQRIQVIE